MMMACTTPIFATPSSLAIRNSHVSKMRTFPPLERVASFGPQFPTYLRRRRNGKIDCGPYPDYDDGDKKDYWGMPEEKFRVRKEILQRLLKLFGATKESSMAEMMEIVERLQLQEGEKIEYFLSEFRKRQHQISSLEEANHINREVIEEPVEVEHNLSDGTVVHLKSEANGAELYLVGVVHVGEESAKEVRDVIRKVQPNVVMLELDENRYKKCLVENQDTELDPFNYFLKRAVSTITNDKMNTVSKIIDLFILGSYQLVVLQGLQPGKEMEVAIEEAERIGAEIVFGDQDYDTTLRRCGEALSMTDLLQCLDLKSVNTRKELSDTKPPIASSVNHMFRDMISDIELRDRKRARQSAKEFAARAPKFHKIMTEERNEVMTKNLRKLRGKIVAVVGLNHLDGIEQLWREANEKYLNEIE